MEIHVTSRHLEVTDAIREYAETKASKLPRYYDRVQQIEVICDHRDHHHEVEIIVDAEHADPFVARSTGEDVYALIDGTVDKLERQLTDHKEKLRNRKHPQNR
ncbi:MAG: ribosome-associated translation inhibitor RaiA [Phycisphaeraceae bacterium]|nr:ribosome-associated translation inhibitor RaiA [Phycisphaeraceae bacterium]